MSPRHARTPTDEIGDYLGIPVIESGALAFDAMYRTRRLHERACLLVGEAAHLRWRIWLHQQRTQARDDALRIVREGLADYIATPLFTATTNSRSN